MTAWSSIQFDGPDFRVAGRFLVFLQSWAKYVAAVAAGSRTRQ